MYPGLFSWWKRRHEAFSEHAVHGGCGSTHEARRHCGRHEHSDGGGGGFGVRRPLRFLSYKLDLNETQTAELARILNDLKTERAQAEVEQRRITAGLADVLAAEAFDEAKANEATALRLKSAERLRDAVGQAIRAIHALLSAEQRGKLAYLIRTGIVSL